MEFDYLYHLDNFQSVRSISVRSRSLSNIGTRHNEGCSGHGEASVMRQMMVGMGAQVYLPPLDLAH